MPIIIRACLRFVAESNHDTFNARILFIYSHLKKEWLLIFRFVRLALRSLTQSVRGHIWNRITVIPIVFSVLIIMLGFFEIEYTSGYWKYLGLTYFLKSVFHGSISKILNFRKLVSRKKISSYEKYNNLYQHLSRK